MAEPYVSVAEFKAAFNISGASDNDDVLLALNAASRAIENAVGGRVFHATDPATARTFSTSNPFVVHTRDFHTTTGLVVRTDSSGDGTFDVTWADADWAAEPSDPDTGWPYNRIVAVGTRRFPTGGRRSRVEVTAKWGWAEVPEDIKLATQILARRLHSRRSHGDLGSLGVVTTEGAIGRIARTDPDVQTLVAPYSRAEVFVA